MPKMNEGHREMGYNMKDGGKGREGERHHGDGGKGRGNHLAEASRVLKGKHHAESDCFKVEQAKG